MSSLLCLPFTFTTSNSTVHTVPYSTLYKLVQSRIVRYTHTIRYTVRYTMRYGVPYTKVWTTLYRVGIPKILDQMTLDQITSDQFTGTPTYQLLQLVCCRLGDVSITHDKTRKDCRRDGVQIISALFVPDQYLDL